MHRYFIPVSLVLLSASALAETAATPIPTVQFTGSATFETLRDDTYVPSENIELDPSRASTQDALKWDTNFPLINFGYPAGEIGVNLGGRSSTDTQVTTMGVPLNLPQGGGADFSFFPGFLWKSARITPTVSSAGFTPQAASGTIEFLPWTREMLRNQGSAQNNRFTVSADRDIQSFSLATRQEDVAILIGTTTGKQIGPAGEFSYDLLHKPGHDILFHVIASEQTGDVINFPATPQEKKITNRVIPVLESHQDLGSNWAVENTLYGDIEELRLQDPTPGAFNTYTRAEQYGIENAIVHGADTLALSARYTLLNNHGSAQDVHEWPLFAALTHDFFPNDSVSVKATVNGTYVRDTGFYPGGKLSTKFSADPRAYPFAELNVIQKMPSLVDRFGVFLDPVYGNFYGNPNLKPEHVYNAIFGYAYAGNPVHSITTLKAEYRTQTQVSETTDAQFDSTVINAGNAYLFSAEQEFDYQFSSVFTLNSRTTLTYSKLKDNGYPYPDLPYMSEGVIFQIKPTRKLSFESQGKLMGQSTTYQGGDHPAYVLFGQNISWYPTDRFSFTGGMDNIFDNHAQVVVGFPIEGRIVYLSMQATF